MPPVAAPADKRFRRAHVKPSSRRRSRLHGAWIATRIVFMVAAFAYGAWRGAWWMTGTPALHVAHVTVSGNQRLSTGEVLSLVDGLHGRNLLGLDLTEWQDRLLASPWVEDATLRRVLPGTVEVTIRERRPIAIGRVDQALYLVDAHGVVVDEYGPAYSDLDLPMVDGLGGRGQARGTIDEARVLLAGRALASLGAHPELMGKVSLIDVSRAHDAVVMLEGDTAMLHLGEEQFAERLQQYLDLGDALRERVAEIDYVDLRFRERLYVRPTKGGSVAQASRLAGR
jgi:cell division protein FtsQ